MKLSTYLLSVVLHKIKWSSDSVLVKGTGLDQRKFHSLVKTTSQNYVILYVWNRNAIYIDKSSRSNTINVNMGSHDTEKEENN